MEPNLEPFFNALQVAVIECTDDERNKIRELGTRLLAAAQQDKSPPKVILHALIQAAMAEILSRAFLLTRSIKEGHIHAPDEVRASVTEHDVRVVLVACTKALYVASLDTIASKEADTITAEAYAKGIFSLLASAGTDAVN